MSNESANCRQLSAAQLKEADYAMFQKEYSKWNEYALDYEWWDCIEYDLKRELENSGVTMLNMFFSLGYSQSDYATFTGTVHVSEWMEHNKDGDQTYAEKYPALYIYLLERGDHASISSGYRGGWGSVNFDMNFGDVYPSGLFKNLDQESWDELVEEQYNDANLSDAIQEWVTARSKQLYRDLQKEYEYLSSEEAFIESCECNGVTFEIEECEV